MVTKGIKILIVTLEDTLQDMIKLLINNKKIKSEVEIIVENEIKEISKVKADIVILEKWDMNLIKSIREMQSNDCEIIVSLDKNNIGLLDYFSEKNITNYILKPYNIDDLNFKINNSIKYIKELKKSNINEIQIKALLDNTPHMTWIKDIEGNYLRVNNKFKTTVNKDEKLIIGQNDSGIWNLEIVNKFRESDLKVVEQKLNYNCYEEVTLVGGKREFNVYKSPIVSTENKVIGTLGIAMDITEEKENEQKVTSLAYSDYLTGVLNRRGLLKYIEELKASKEKLFTIMFIDLDNFKKLNDSFGHYYGDRALVKIVSRLKRISKGAKISRIGGDEFVIVWDSLQTKESIDKKANEVLECLTIEFAKGERSIPITGSIGVVSGNIDKTTYEELLLKGDSALYKAKEKGKNQFVFYTKKLEEELSFNLQIEADIKKAIEKDEIKLKYQPQYNIYGALVGFEALFRWENPKYKSIPVIDIIKAIEKFQVMDVIGDYILKEAFKFTKRVNDMTTKDIVISVNISALQIMSNNFVQKFKDMLDEFKVQPKHVGIEITETVLLENMEENIDKVKQLRDLGIKVSIDDFGTGYSSLNYLVKLPIKSVKIDKSFIKEIEEREEYVKLVSLIIEIAHALSMKVVVEGVETLEQLSITKKMGADIIQGYIFSKPIDGDIAIRNYINGIKT